MLLTHVTTFFGGRRIVVRGALIAVLTGMPDVAVAQPLQVTHLAGSPGGYGSADGQGAAARFNLPMGIAVDVAGNLYVADTGNSTIRKVTPAGLVSTLAGRAGAPGYLDATGAAARFSEPTGITVDADGIIYVADTKNHVVRRITPAGVVSTLAGSSSEPGYGDGTGTDALFDAPRGIVVDSRTSTLFVTDAGNGTIRRITAAGVVTTIVAPPVSPGPPPVVFSPHGIAIEDGGTLLVADAMDSSVIRVTQQGVATRLAGGSPAYYDGQGLESSFRFPAGLARDASGITYVADQWNHAIRMVTPGGLVSTLAGSRFVGSYADGVGTQALFNIPGAVAVSTTGVVYVADTGNHAIRRVTAAGEATTVAGTVLQSGDADGTGGDARFFEPAAIAVDTSGNAYVTETGPCRIRRITPAGVVTTWAGVTGACAHQDGPPETGRLMRPGALAVDAAGTLYVADGCSIRTVSPDRVLSTLAGSRSECGFVNGTGTQVRLGFLPGLAVGPDGTLYVADTGNNAIRTVSAAGVVATLTGGNGYNSIDGPKETAAFMGPSALAFNSLGDLYVAANFGNFGEVVRKVAPDGYVTSVAGWWVFGRSGLARGPGGGLYISDTFNHTVRFLTLDGQSIIVAGTSYAPGNVDGIGKDARLNQPAGIAATADGKLYVVEEKNHDVRLGVPSDMRTLTLVATVGGSVTSDLPGIDCGTSCTADYPADTRVTLTATGMPWYGFAGWSGGGCSGTGPCTLALTTNTTISASFVPCAFSVPTLFATAPATGGPNSVPLTATAGCAWSVGSSVPWMSTSASGVGSGTITFTTTTNSDDVPRYGFITMGTGIFFRVTQAGQISTTLFTNYLAEGATSSFLSTRIALFNPTEFGTSALMTFSRASANPVVASVPVPALTRVTVDPKTVAGLAQAEFSTLIESNRRLVVDRTMSWDATGYGAHTETAVPAPAVVWYLAEGATHSGFDLFYLLQNPSASSTTVKVRYLRPSAAPIEKNYVLPPTSRTNIWVNVEEFPGLGLALASTDVSAVVESLDATPIIVERAMYLSNQGRIFNAGHESAGVTAPSTRWFLAEGNTGPYFDLFVLIANPGPQDAHVRVTYLLTSGQTYTRTFVAPANSRSNVWVDAETFEGVPGLPLADVAVSTTIESENGVPLIVERSLWWWGDFSTWVEGHNSAGATSTGTTWTVADGEVGGEHGAETYLLIANTSAFAGEVTVTVYREDGASFGMLYGLNARSRTNVPIAHDFGDFVKDRRFGVIVQPYQKAPVQIVVERSVYWNAGGVTWAAGTNALATKLR